MKRDILALSARSPDRRIPYGDDPNQFFDLWAPAQPRAVAMMIHGGFWRAKYDLFHTSHACWALAKSGIAVANLEYRRVGNIGGGWPGTYDDVRAGLTAVQRQFPGQKKFVVLGHSAGGQLALRLAIDTPELTGVVALAPVAVLKTAYDLDLSHGAVAEFLGGTPSSVPGFYEAACPSRHPSSVQRILIHGTHDDVVPLSMTEEFCDLRQHDSGTVWPMRITEADHFDLVDPESLAWPMIHTDTKSLIED